jgi:hypothetical protein
MSIAIRIHACGCTTGLLLQAHIAFAIVTYHADGTVCASMLPPALRRFFRDIKLSRNARSVNERHFLLVISFYVKSANSAHQFLHLLSGPSSVEIYSKLLK